MRDLSHAAVCTLAHCTHTPSLGHWLALHARIDSGLADGALGAAATAAQEELHCLVDGQHDEDHHHALQ